MSKWKTLKSKFVLDNPWCRIRQDEVELPNGEIIDDYFVRVRPDIALILPVTANDEIVFVRQYRHGVKKVVLELPAGNFYPKQEDSLMAAVREMEEETGYTASNVAKLATLYENPGNDTSTIHLFIAHDATFKGQQKLDPTEDIEVVLIPKVEILTKIFQGEICVSGTVTALFLGLSLLSDRSLEK